MFGLGPLEIVVIGAIAVMLYGKRLPEVGRSVGQSLGQLRKQFTTLQREMDISSHIDAAANPSRRPATRRIDDGGSGPTTQAPRFDPPPAAADEACGHPGRQAVADDDMRRQTTADGRRRRLRSLLPRDRDESPRGC